MKNIKQKTLKTLTFLTGFMIGVSLVVATNLLCVTITEAYTQETESKTETEASLNYIVSTEPETLGIQTETEIYYPNAIIATEIDENFIVTAVDYEGMEWRFISEDVCVGNIYTCIFSDNGTQGYIKDDKIINIRLGFASETE